MSQCDHCAKIESNCRPCYKKAEAEIVRLKEELEKAELARDSAVTNLRSMCLMHADEVTTHKRAEERASKAEADLRCLYEGAAG
jgi:hypothetical protein